MEEQYKGLPFSERLVKGKGAELVMTWNDSKTLYESLSRKSESFKESFWVVVATPGFSANVLSGCRVRVCHNQSRSFDLTWSLGVDLGFLQQLFIT